MEATTQLQFARCLFFSILHFQSKKKKKTLFVLKAISASINRPEQCVQGNRGRARLQEHVFTPTSKLHNKRLQHFFAKVEAGKRQLIFW